MKRWPLIITVLMTAVFVIFFSWFTLGRHWKINSGRFDLGNVEQTVWNVVHGHGFTMTDPYGTAQVSRLSFHADPFLLLLAPFYAIFPMAETLLVLQVLFVASGAIAVFLIGRQVLSNPWWGTVFSWLYMCYPGIQWALIFDVHAVTFAMPLLLWAFWSVIKKKYWLTLVFVILSMITKEQIGLGLMLIGVFVWWRQRQIRWGAVLTFIPLLWSMLMLLVVIPHFSSNTSGTHEVYQTIFGNGAIDIIQGAVQHPVSFIHQLLAKQNLVMVAQLLAPLGFLSLGSAWSLGALPDYSINALSLKPAQHLLISHYTSGLTPWLFIGAILSTSWLLMMIRQRAKLEHNHHTWQFAIVLWLIGWSAYSTWTTGPLPKTPHDQSKFVTWENPYAVLVRDWANRIPSSAAVSVTNDIGSQFARREFLHSFPLGVEQADYVVVLENHATPVVVTNEEVRVRIAELRTSSAWQLLVQQGDLTILRRMK